MMIVRFVKIRPHERGLLYEDGTFTRILGPGRHTLWGVRVRVEKVSVREVWFKHADLEVMVKVGALGDEAEVIDLKDHERALVWVDGRLEAVVGPGLTALWKVFRTVKVEVHDAQNPRCERADLALVLAARGAREFLEPVTVATGWVGLIFRDGRYVGDLGPGVAAFWKGEGLVKVLQVDLREQSFDLAGQDIMTADKVTLRLNALVVYRVVDALKAATEVDDYAQALYRQAQLALRAVVGTRELDQLLAEKDAVARELAEILAARAKAFGIEVSSLGIRDIILPGEMREILNRVTEARKVAEASLITRREETAAMRSQANTAKIFETSPMLLRLRELEVLEKVAGKANLSVFLGEGGLAERVMKLV